MLKSKGLELGESGDGRGGGDGAKDGLLNDDDVPGGDGFCFIGRGTDGSEWSDELDAEEFWRYREDGSKGGDWWM